MPITLYSIQLIYIYIYIYIYTYIYIFIYDIQFEQLYKYILIKNCLVYLGNNGINERKQKGDASSKSIESFMSCRGILTFIRLIQIMER